MPASKVWVTTLTVGAIAAVTVLAVQAGKGPHPTAASSRPSASPSAGASPAPTKSARPAAVPESSGTGRRIVYALGQKRVWLVDAGEAARRTFAVWPGTVSPDPGTYTVSSRNMATTGSDGVQIENIVYFTAKDGINIAFSNAVDGASPPPAEGKRTGGVRMRAADGAALWTFAETGTRVTVVE
ncbi:secreted protein [Streptomyces zinciresistens K42]|uniref:Secreted protein n=1 Tax=Streptomyces zinciresistens K42 TaxID=700597 RepID=G2G7M8_9ACTN|nr:L,D-transpeptidase [Streptomyces zinciresistens]EGX60454.1 secreted protein [Streptomyces zinciresistens K42]